MSHKFKIGRIYSLTCILIHVNLLVWYHGNFDEAMRKYINVFVRRPNAPMIRVLSGLKGEGSMSGWELLHVME